MSGGRKQGAWPPETLEGWYSLHDAYAQSASSVERDSMVRRAADRAAAHTGTGWTAVVALFGGRGDLLVIHFRETPEELDAARWQMADTLAGAERVWSQLGVTEAGLYHATAEVAAAAAERGGEAGDPQYETEVAQRAAAERASEHVQRRLYPPLPEAMPYVSFYPMSKRRDRKQNWYTLTLDERSSLMRSHGLVGRRFAGRVQQIITGSVGLADWEWGVTLFARDLLDVKRLVTEMRFDEASARYAEFGEFFVGRLVTAGTESAATGA